MRPFYLLGRLRESRFGRLDVLVNNAGVGGAGRLEDTTAGEWDRVMDLDPSVL